MNDEYEISEQYIADVRLLVEKSRKKALDLKNYNNLCKIETNASVEQYIERYRMKPEPRGGLRK